jgi:hypothetical protein
MSRETLKDFLNSVGEGTADKISYVIDTSESTGNQDLGIDPNTGLPIISEGNSISGDYLKYLTDENNNIHNFNQGNKEGERYKLGDTLTLSNNSSVKDPYLPPNMQQTNYSNSEYLGNNSDLRDIVDKLGTNPGQNSNLLKSVEGRNASQSNQIVTNSTENNNILDAVQNMRSDYNRFNGSNSEEVFKDNNYNISDFNNSNTKPGTYTSQNNFGKYENNVIEKSTLSNEKLLSIGKSILLSAGGWDKTGGSEDPDAFKVSIDTLPSIDLGLLVDNDNIKARNAHNAPQDNAGNSTRIGRNEFYAERDKVNQTLYNNKFKFGSVDTKIAKLLCASTLINIFELFSEIINTLVTIANTDRVKDLNNYNGTGPHALGGYRVSNDSKIDFIAKNILTYTDYKFSDCFKTGIKVCFGLDYKNGKITSTLSESAISKNNQLNELRMFWTNISFSVLRRSPTILEKFQDFSSGKLVDNFLDIINKIRTSSILGLINALATIGNISLKQTFGNLDSANLKKYYSPYDVDSIKDTRGTRIHKSRKRTGFNLLESSTSERSTTSMYLLPPNVIHAAVDMGNLFSGQNPSKGMLGSSLIQKTFVDFERKSFNKIPQSAVKELEDRLEAEYVPFYIQDLRTNEIIHFHAFLGKLTDQINPTFTKSKGFGRLDPVQIYEGTTRTVNFDFTLVATSREDFDEMWYKINKLTTLAYPQWSKGTKVTSPDGRTFTQPFSQVIAGSPIVRVRIGDVIKSNYSKFNLARIFGIGDGDNTLQPQKDIKLSGNRSKLGNKLEKNIKSAMMKAFNILYGSPLAEGNVYEDLVKKLKLGSVGDEAASSLLSKFLVNGYANPLGVAAIINQLTDPDVADVDSTISTLSVASLGNSFNASIDNALKNGYQRLTTQKIKPSSSRGYLIDGEIYHIDRPLRILILEKKKDRKGNISTMDTDSSLKSNSVVGSKKPYNFNETRTQYKVKIIDTAAPHELLLKEVNIYHTDIIPNYSALYNLFVAPTLLALEGNNILTAGQSLLKLIAVELGVSLGLGDDDIVNLLSQNGNLLPDAAKFMSSKQIGDSPANPFTNAFESNMGRGLAGTLGAASFDWLAFPWELDYNARAPMGVKISYTLDVIHDLPPGLDHSGYNRAPLYNVGNIMKNISGDSNGRSRSGEFNYSVRSTGANRKGKKKGD